ncbi:MAG: hypothetical protein K0R19_2828 [Bacillota bacterium]|jgi:isopentenyldiphosphate isomerase|nr:hypothetical protein [Bacillota bacterium]
MEWLDIVDETGNITGQTIEREIAHRKGVRHRTSHVWVLRNSNGKTQVLLQKRSENKDSFPGCYDISSAGHIPAGDGFLESALRELKEELGIDAVPEELIYCGQRQFEFRERFHGKDFWDNQVSNIYALWRDTEASSLTIQKAEIENVLWMDLVQCIEMVKNNTAPNCIWLEELEMISSMITS